jgi:superfamily II DNA helicase RecQ
MGPVALPADARLARLKELRRDVVRSLGTMFFQHMPDQLLQELIARPPKSLEQLRDDFEVHNKIIENFGVRIVHVLSAGQKVEPRAKLVAVSEASVVSPLFATPISKAPIGPVPAAPRNERTSRAKVAAAKEVAGGKVGVLHGRAVEARFERLRTLRLELARKNQWPAYCVLQDATLLEIARSQPRTMRELLEIKGMGPKRAERFGKELLAELARE